MTGGKQRWIGDPFYTFKKTAKEIKRGLTTSEKLKPIPEPDPLATPLELEEMEAAKRKVKGKRRGRYATILAGRLLNGRGAAQGKILY